MPCDRMKTILYAAIVALLAIAAYIAVSHYGALPAPAPSVGEAGGEADAGGSGPSVPAPPPYLNADTVAGILVAHPDGRECVVLEKRGGAWHIVSLFGAPADADKVALLLRALLASERQPVDIEPSHTGTEGGDGIDIVLTSAGNQPYRVRLGLHPIGQFDAVYMRDGDGSPYLVADDVRGMIGLWQNASGASPDGRFWLQTRILSFDSALARSLAAVYPDHVLAFERSEDETWRLDGSPPGGEWNAGALAAWLDDLSRFVVVDVAGRLEDMSSVTESPTHRVDIALANGDVKSLRVCPDRTNDGVWVWASDYPEHVFMLPLWRFKRYFQRFGDLFPAAVPFFPASDVRLIDLHRGGESVKILYRDGSWRAPLHPYPLTEERVRRLVRNLSAWRAEDGATVRGAASRILTGPILDVVLANGEAHRYHLGGRHPVFPWRYVVMDGSVRLAADEDRTAALFPAFSELFDLGSVFDGVSMDMVERIEFSSLDENELLFVAAREGEGGWESRTEAGTLDMPSATVERIVDQLLAWRVSGLFKEDVYGGREPERLFGVRIVLVNGGERTVVLLSPNGRDIPCVDDRGRAMRVSLGDFISWTRAIREVGQKIRLEARRATISDEGGEADADVPELDAPMGD